MAANPSIQLGTDGNWAIKEDNLLAYKKDGDRFFNKEFDFTRGSLATFVDKDGLIKYSGVTDTELVTNGNFDSDSDWSNFGTPTTSEQSTDKAYIGSYSWYVVASAFRQGIFSPNNFSLVSGKTYRASLWIYALDGAEILSGVTNSDATVFTSRAVMQGQWTNVVYYFTATASSASYISILSSHSTLEFYVDNVSVKEIQTDVPRIDFTDDATGHLLLEPQSTNVLENSEITSTWTYTEFGSGSAGTITTGKTDMFGGTNAVQVDFPADAENVSLAFGQTTSSISSGSATTSVYIKLVESGSKTLQLRCSTGVISNVLVDTTDFVRYEATGTKSSGESFQVKLRPSSGTSSGGFSIIICQPQEEALSYSTSYIPTQGSTVTRNADVCNNSGSAQDFNSEEGVLYAEIAALADDGTSRRISLSNGSTSNTVEILFQNTGTVSFQVKSGNSFQGGGTFNLTQTEFNKIAVKYKANDLALWVNGLERSADNSANTPIGLLELAFDDGGGGSDFYGKTKDLKVFKRAMSDSELYLLTVPQYQSYQEMATALNYTL